jgi:hypothetical protein
MFRARANIADDFSPGVAKSAKKARLTPTGTTGGHATGDLKPVAAAGPRFLDL